MRTRQGETRDTQMENLHRRWLVQRAPRDAAPRCSQCLRRTALCDVCKVKIVAKEKPFLIRRSTKTSGRKFGEDLGRIANCYRVRQVSSGQRRGNARVELKPAVRVPTDPH